MRSNWSILAKVLISEGYLLGYIIIIIIYDDVYGAQTMSVKDMGVTQSPVYENSNRIFAAL